MGSTYDERARARGDWPVRRFRLGEEPGDDLSDSTTAEQRVAMVSELTTRAWLLAGPPLPEYDRASIPGRLVRRTR